MSLWHDFNTNNGKMIHKWSHYFPIYERYFGPWKNKSLTFLEIGVQRGGSLQMWQRYFGPMAKIVGIDINKDCKAHEQPGIFVRIGDQKDPKVLQAVIDEFGVPDVILDDGSHMMDDILQTFLFLYPRQPKNAIYMVEDLHTAYWPEFGGGNTPASFINVCKTYIDKLNADHSRGTIQPDFITRQTFGISFYDSIVVFEKGEIFRKDAPQIGKA